jgi:hypothetical protein
MPFLLATMRSKRDARRNLALQGLATEKPAAACPCGDVFQVGEAVGEVQVAAGESALQCGEVRPAKDLAPGE